MGKAVQMAQSAAHRLPQENQDTMDSRQTPVRSTILLMGSWKPSALLLGGTASIEALPHL